MTLESTQAGIIRRVRRRWLSWRFSRAFGEPRGVVVEPGVTWHVDRQASLQCNSAQVEIGYRWPQFPPLPSALKAASGSTLKFTGSFRLVAGFLITVNEDALLSFDSGYVNYRATIECFREITIGKDTVIGPDVTIRDSDNHTIAGSSADACQPVHIGEHVWIGSRATILKGVTLGHSCIVAAGAVVTKSFPAGCLIGGVPARVIREGVTWQ